MTRVIPVLCKNKGCFATFDDLPKNEFSWGCKLPDSMSTASPVTFQSEMSLHWRHNGRDGVSNHQPHDCLPNRLFRRRSKKTSKLRVTCICAGNSPVNDEFPAQMTSNAKMSPFDDVIMWRRFRIIDAQSHLIFKRNIMAIVYFTRKILCHETLFREFAKRGGTHPRVLLIQ